MPEELLGSAIDAVVLAIEAAGAGVIRHHDVRVFTPIRLSLGRFLTLGLEFQLSADILRTAVAPSFEEIGQLAAIAAIRTALNYFLGREIEQEQLQIQQRADAAHPGSATP